MRWNPIQTFVEERMMRKPEFSTKSKTASSTFYDLNGIVFRWPVEENFAITINIVLQLSDFKFNFIDKE